MITGINMIRNGIQNGYPFLESILSVLPLCDEYLVNDGGSTDGTLQALQRLKEAHPKVRLFQIPDRPMTRWDCISDVINHFIRTAKSQWIYLGNADELLHEKDVNRLRALVEAEEEADVIRFDRKEVIKKWSQLTQAKAYFPARMARRIPGIYQNWNSYGGDEFLDADGWVKDPPRAKAIETIIVYHLYAVFPQNMLNKRRNDAERLAPGDKSRVANYERLKGKKFVGSPPQPEDVYPDLPALAHGLTQMTAYKVREELFDPSWLRDLTGLEY